jgi:hypothetical protein
MSRPGRSLPPGKTRYLLYRRLDGPQGRSGQVRKISPPSGSDPRTVQPVASRYIDWATRPTLKPTKSLKFFCVATLIIGYVTEVDYIHWEGKDNIPSSILRTWICVYNFPILSKISAPESFNSCVLNDDMGILPIPISLFFHVFFICLLKHMQYLFLSFESMCLCVHCA